VVEPVQDGGLVAPAEVEGNQVAGRGAVGFGGRELGPIGLESGGVDGAVAGQEPSQLVGVEVPADGEGQEQRVANLLWAGLLPARASSGMPPVRRR